MGALSLCAIILLSLNICTAARLPAEELNEAKVILKELLKLEKAAHENDEVKTFMQEKTRDENDEVETFMQKRTRDDCTGTSGSFSGIEYASLGYNLLRGYPLTAGRDPGFTSPIFNPSYDPAIFSDNCEFQLPNGFNFQPITACATSMTSNEISNKYAFDESLSTTTNTEAGGWGVSFSASTEYKNSVSSMDETHGVMVLSEAECQTYYAELNRNSPPQFADGFLADLRQLQTYTDDDAYLQFIDTRGTHYIKDMTFGARFAYRYDMTSEQHNTLTESSFSIETQASYSGIFTASGGVGMSQDQREAAENFQKNTKSSSYSVGAPPTSDGNALGWASAVNLDNPMPIIFTLSSIENLFTEAYFKNTDIDYQTIRDHLTKVQPMYCQMLKERGEVNTCETDEPGDYKFRISAYTPDVTDADTSGNIHVTLTGELASCPEMLINDGRSLKQNAILQFTGKCLVNPGLITSVTVRLDGTDGWYMQQLVVEDLWNHHTYEIPCDCWFDSDGDPYLTTRTFTPGQRFELTVTTPDISNGDSSNTIYVTMTGQGGSCGEFPMNSVSLSRDSVQTFTTTCSDIGLLESIKLRNSGNDGWVLEKIMIRDVTYDRVYYLPCNEWLDTDTTATRTLYTDFKNNVNEGSYNIATYTTSGVDDAGTDGEVFVTLVGEQATCKETKINEDQSLEHDIIVHTSIDCGRSIGRLIRVDVRLTTNDGWHLQNLVIQDTWNHYTYELPCNCWFDNDDPSEPSSRSLTPENLYKLTTFTSNLVNAETDDNIYMTLEGDKTTCSGLTLNDGQSISRNSAQTFTATCSDIGVLKKVTFRIESTDGWTLDHLIIREVLTGRLYYLPCSCAIDSGSESVDPSSWTLIPAYSIYVVRKGDNSLTKDEASALCEANGDKLATPYQLQKAFDIGFDVCECGWLSDGIARQPIQWPRKECPHGDLRGVTVCNWEPTLTGFCFHEM